MPDNFTINDEFAGVRIDKWFRKQYATAPHSLFLKLNRKKKIKVNGKRVAADYSLTAQDKIVVFYNMTEVEQLDKRGNKGGARKTEITDKDIAEFKKLIIFENADYIVINKPHGLASQGGSGVTVSVDDYIQKISERYKLVHRLDKDTSGCLAIAKKTTAAARFAEVLQAGKMEKSYVALVLNSPPQKHGYVNLPLLKKGERHEKVEVDPAGKEAKSEYRLIKSIGNCSLVELQPHTGRTHQLRVHMLALGCPIIGDGKYGGQAVVLENFSRKLHLHAYNLYCKELGIDARAELPEHMQEFEGFI